MAKNVLLREPIGHENVFWDGAQLEGGGGLEDDANVGREAAQNFCDCGLRGLGQVVGAQPGTERDVDDDVNLGRVEPRLQIGRKLPKRKY